ncbi:MAG: UDP-N-acetylglucosamine 1-carboxyvinyltransferase [Microthrixaceae bacterium]|nr:UDP-N-acetylglucosamine 1-carboxyvinyltransferase [Microthrixaceae bacterium]
MDQMIVRPGGALQGEIPISGAKNSVLKLMAATVLTPGRFVIRNVPRISDVDWMADSLVALGLVVDWADEHTMTVDATGDITPEAPYHLVEQMRASTALLGALLARCGEARIAMPGGDDFGDRPIDMHLRGLEELGAEIELSHGTIVAKAPRLTGARVVLEYPSVGATENLLLAATRAEGVTVIENAAREPEIADLAAFVNRMGARVVGAGSSTVTITGVDELHSVEHEVIPDRVEAATYLAILGAARGELLLRGARHGDLHLLARKLGDMGMRISPDAAGVWAMATGRPVAVDVATLPYPGIATDYLPMLIALLSVADGTSFATENLFQGRFRYVGELTRMGANIRVEGHHMAVRGVERLSGAPVRAFDIRAGAALVVAAFAAEGETTIHDAHHLDRGYEAMVGRLVAVGADVVGR